MKEREFIFAVLLMLTLGEMLLPQAHLSVVVCALLLAAIRRESSAW